MTQFSYKPALLIGPYTYDLTDEAVICTDKSGAEKWRMEWGDVYRATYVEHFIKSSRMRRLDLAGAPGKLSCSISFTGPKGDPMQNADGAEHLRLLVAILKKLSDRTEGFQVSVGEHGKSRLIMFIIGVLTLLFGVGLGGFVLAAGVSSSKLADGAIPMLLMVAFGAGLIWKNAPWRPVPQLSASVFVNALEGITGAKNDQS